MSYLSAQNADSPLSRWKFEETTGTAIDDDVTTTRDGTLSGGVTLNQPAGYSDANLGAAFNGSTGFMSIGNMSTLLDIGTIEAVVKFNTIPATARSAIFMHSWTSGAIPLVLGFNVDNTHAGLLGVGYYTGSVWQTAHWATTPAVATNYHIVATYDGATIKLRVNGVQVASTAVTTIRPTIGTVNAAAFVGKFYSGGTAFLDGTLWDVALYSSALGTGQANTHFSALANPYFDNFANAQAVTLGANMVNIDTSGWTTEASEPGAIFQTGWATLTPTTTRTFLLSSIGSDYDTVINVYTGTALNNLVLVGTDDDSGGSGTSSLQLSLTSGTTYYIQVGAKTAGSGGLLAMVVDARSEARLAQTNFNVLVSNSASRQLATYYSEAVAANNTTNYRNIATYYSEAVASNNTTNYRNIAMVYYEALVPSNGHFVGWGIPI